MFSGSRIGAGRALWKCRCDMVMMLNRYRQGGALRAISLPGETDRGTVSAMEMHQIRYFLAVCDSLNFTRAAEACNVTQPALTRAFPKLEKGMGGLLCR